MNEKEIVNLIKNLDVTDLAGEKVMIDFDTGKYFLLKGSANDIWDLIQTPVSIEDIKINLMNKYEVSEDECLSGISDFLKTLLDFGFISVK